jgi:hypothetical protein
MSGRRFLILLLVLDLIWIVFELFPSLGVAIGEVIPKLGIMAIRLIDVPRWSIASWFCFFGLIAAVLMSIRFTPDILEGLRKPVRRRTSMSIDLQHNRKETPKDNLDPTTKILLDRARTRTRRQ